MTQVAINKVSWQQVGHVAEPGRYMFRFGWLTITPEDLAVWNRFPDALFVLVKAPTPAATDEAEEFHLGVFDLSDNPSPGES
jgi:hypothetical protein